MMSRLTRQSSEVIRKPTKMSESVYLSMVLKLLTAALANKFLNQKAGKKRLPSG